jgi:hypothetical protein
LIEPGQTETSWNANPTFASWFFVAPYLSVLYVAYVASLMGAAIWIVKRLDGGKAAFDMLWFACLSYLLAGWLASFVLFLHSAVLFYIFHRAVAALGRKSRALPMARPTVPESQ